MWRGFAVWTCLAWQAWQVVGGMPLIKVQRINKGGEILINSAHLLFAEVESRTTTLHMTGNLLFSIEGSLDALAQQVEAMETARVANALQQSGPAAQPG
jgi:hypothetical protein